MKKKDFINTHFENKIIDLSKLIEESKQNKTYLIIQINKPKFVYIGFGFFVPNTLEFLRMDLETAKNTSNKINNTRIQSNLNLFCCVIPIDEYLNIYYEKN